MENQATNINLSARKEHQANTFSESTTQNIDPAKPNHASNINFASIAIYWARMYVCVVNVPSHARRKLERVWRSRTVMIDQSQLSLPRIYIAARGRDCLCRERFKAYCENLPIRDTYDKGLNGTTHLSITCYTYVYISLQAL